jgi:hypothetical protein
MRGIGQLGSGRLAVPPLYNVHNSKQANRARNGLAAKSKGFHMSASHIYLMRQQVIAYQQKGHTAPSLLAIARP